MAFRVASSRFKIKRRSIGTDLVQLIGGWLFAIFLPYQIWFGKFSDFSPPANLDNVIVTCSLAILIGHYFYRRLVVFPGARASAYIAPVFAAAYGAVLLTFFVFRFDYSSVLFLSSFASCIAWYYLGYFVEKRTRQRRLAVVPSTSADRLIGLAGVEWTMLDAQPEIAEFDGLVADFRADLSEGWERFIAEQAIAGVPVYHIKQIEESLTGMVDIEHLSENNFGSLIPGLAYIKLKQFVEWVLAMIAGLILLPALLVVAFAVKLDSRGPVLFRQSRMGYRGKPFTVFKFRSMVVATPAAGTERDHAMTRDGDNRITRLGRFLRRSRIDELPQILNILRGEMSLIGPRPEAIVLSSWYEKEIPFYRYRHIVRPGISGWAQVNQGHVTGVNDVHAKLKYDFYYIKYFSPWLDILITLRTIRTIFTGFGVR